MNTEKHSDREVEDLAAKEFPMKDYMLANSFEEMEMMTETNRNNRLRREGYRAGFKAGQEIQGEEMKKRDYLDLIDMVEEDLNEGGQSYDVTIEKLKSQFTIKKKQQ